MPGASAETMAASVTTPLERQFSLIAGVTELTSTSSLGSSSITVQFNLDRDIDAAASDILSAINAASAQLPTNLPSPPSYRKVNPADSPILLLALTSASLPLTVVDDSAENVLAQQLSQISGVAQVTINGQQKPAVRIQLDPAKIASLGLALEDVRAQIVAASTEAPKGTFDGPRQSFAVYDNDQILTRGALERHHRRLPQRRAGAHPRHRPGGGRAGEHQARRLGERHAVHPAGGLQAARRQCDRDGQSGAGGAAASPGGDPGGDRRDRSCPIAPRRSAPRSPTWRPPW